MLAVLPFLQEGDDLPTLRRCLEQATLSRDDESLYGDLAGRAARSRDMLAREKDEAARILLSLPDTGALEAGWSPKDPALQASLAWIAGHKGDKRRIPELTRRLRDPDPRIGFAAARALHRLFDDKEYAEFRRRHKLQRRDAGGGTLPDEWLAHVRENREGGPLLSRSFETASDEQVILFLHLLPDDRFRSLAAARARGLPVMRLRKAAARGDALAEYARKRLDDVVLRFGGPGAVFPSQALDPYRKAAAKSSRP